MNPKQHQLEKAERAWYRAKARAEQAADCVSDCERKVTRLKEELNCTEVPGNTRLQIERIKQMPKKLKGILIEVNGVVVSYVQFNGKPVAIAAGIIYFIIVGSGMVNLAQSLPFGF